MRLCNALPVVRGLVGVSIVAVLAGAGPAASPTAAAPSSTSFPIPAEGPAVVKARTAALLLSEMAGGEVRASVIALPGLRGAAGTAGRREAGRREAGETPRPLWVKVEIDAGGLWDGEEGGSEAVPRLDPQGAIPVEVFLYALRPDGEFLDAFTVRFDLSSAARRELLEGRGLAVAATLEVPPGEIRLRHLVWSEPPGQGQRFGLGTTRATVPSEDPPSVLWIPERSHRWMWVTPPGKEVEVWMVGESMPAALPVLETPESAPRQAVSWWRVGGGPPEGVLRLQPEDPARADDRAEVSFEVLETRRGVAGGELVRLVFEVPAVEPGRYRLILQPRGGEAPLPLPVVVAGPDGGEVWPRVLPAGVDPTEEPSPQDDLLPLPESPAAGRRTVAEDATDDGAIDRRRYRAVIARMAGGDPEGAATDLARWEAEALEGLEGDDLDAALLGLVEAQRGIAAELLGPRAEGALALALLHAEAARRHVRASRWLLADRTVEQAVWLAEGHAMARESREARRDAASLLAWMAADLRQAGRGSKARAMFQRSLDIEEIDAALLGLATLDERSGRISEAVATLERLVERDPSHREARLRLAVNLSRLGRTDSARQLLRPLVRTVDSSWVTAVAFQELARIDLDGGDCAGAARVLRRAIERIPGEPQLAVQLAWALECAGQAVASREVAAGIVEKARREEPDGDCPRTRYTRWSDDALAGERRRLGEVARESRQALAARLNGMGVGP